MFSRTYVDLFRSPLQKAEQLSQISINSRRLVPGILVDAVVFTEAGWPALTVSRADWFSLTRIHSRNDHLTHMTGAGVELAASFMASLVETIAVSERARKISYAVR